MDGLEGYWELYLSQRGSAGWLMRVFSPLTHVGSSVDRVWVSYAKEGYVAGWVVKEEGDASVVALQSGDEVRFAGSRERRRNADGVGCGR